MFSRQDADASPMRAGRTGRCRVALRAVLLERLRGYPPPDSSSENGSYARSVRRAGHLERLLYQPGQIRVSQQNIEDFDARTEPRPPHGCVDDLAQQAAFPEIYPDEITRLEP